MTAATRPLTTATSTRRVYHASTMLYPSAEAYVAHRSRYQYGRRGTPTSEAFQNALKDIEGPACEGVALLPSGLSAISTALLSVLRAGDHVLVSDSAYFPTRKLCDDILTRYGIATTYYDPAVGAGIAALLQPNIRAVFVESPARSPSRSRTFPPSPLWRTRMMRGGDGQHLGEPALFRALDKGVDLSIQSGTKYIGGHSDLMLGAAAANKATWGRLKQTVYETGLCVGPDDMFLGMRGLRTLGVRLAQHQTAGLKVARWLEAVRKFCACFTPPSKAIPATPFGNATSPAPAACSASFSSRHHRPRCTRSSTRSRCSASALGGGFESLAIPFDCAPIRTATRWEPGGPTVRLHIGLEDTGDLIADLGNGFAAFTAAFETGAKARVSH